jgi:hypothetical protein
LLLVTEAMAQTSTNTLKSGHSDWWELTNRDTNAVNLRGYKFSDLPGPSLEPGSPFVIKNDVIIQPGESIIFVRNMSREAFMDWWGEENLPADLQIITYTGHNFQPQRDGAYLYGPAATDPLDYVCGVNFDFCDPTDPTDPNCVILAGVSKWFDPVEAQYGEFSVLGERGAIRAVEADDVGSPGWTANHPPREYSPRFTSLVRNSAGATLTWEARPNKRYELQYKNALTETNWTPLSQRSATGLALTVLDPSATNAARRFYRLQLLP